MLLSFIFGAGAFRSEGMWPKMILFPGVLELRMSVARALFIQPMGNEIFRGRYRFFDFSD